MEILYLLVPMSVVLALGVMGLLAWAVWSGQFEDIEGEGQRIFQEPAERLPGDVPQPGAAERKA